MTRQQLEHVKKVLLQINNPDNGVLLALRYLDKDITARQKQREAYIYDLRQDIERYY